MPAERVIWEAEFNPAVTSYWLCGGAIVLAVTIVGILLVPFWFLFGGVVTRRYLASHQCTLTQRSLKFRKGVFVKQEKTVPLDRITDLGLIQGPIMRFFDIEALSVETAGQSAAGSLIQLAGIRDGRAFRDAVLTQRDRVVGSEEERITTGTASPSPSVDQQPVLEVLTQIHQTLQRIETKLDKPSEA